jgi:phosphoribosylglycinamide formyltransferase-1
LQGFIEIPSKYYCFYPNKIINIHPALLPKYGGKGMYGMNVHKAVVANKKRNRHNNSLRK